MLDQTSLMIISWLFHPKTGEPVIIQNKNRFMFHLKTYGCCVSAIFMEFITFIDPPALRLRIARFPQTFRRTVIIIRGMF